MSDDVVSTFLAITGSKSEDTAIQYLSMTNFDVSEAVQIFLAAEGDTNASAPSIPDERRADAYIPEATTLHESGGRFETHQGAVDDAFLIVDDSVAYPTEFIERHFSAMAHFALPNYGCDSRYKCLDSRVGNSTENQIVTNFDYCCRIARRQNKMVLLAVFEGMRSFADMCLIRDVFRHNQFGTFLNDNFLCFFQVAVPEVIHTIQTQRLGSINRTGDVLRMEQLLEFLSRYGLDTSGSINRSYDHRPSDDEVTRRTIDNFCNRNFPIMAIISPDTKALVKQIPMTSIVKIHRANVQYDPIQTTEQLTSLLTRRIVSENFFINEPSDAPRSESGENNHAEGSPEDPAHEAYEEPNEEVAQEEPPVTDVEAQWIDLSQFVGSSVATDDVVRLRLRHTKGMLDVNVSGLMPVSDLFFLLTSLHDQETKVIPNGYASSKELVALRNRSSFLCGFPPKPLDIPETTMSIREWRGVRSGDTVTLRVD